jgi:hypothetical protein
MTQRTIFMQKFIRLASFREEFIEHVIETIIPK